MRAMSTRPTSVVQAPPSTTPRQPLTMGKNKGKAAAKASADTAEPAPAPASGLSSFLLEQASGKDADLDDIFAHSVRDQSMSVAVEWR